MNRYISGIPIVLLTCLWVALWGDVTWGNVVAGMVIAICVTWIFPMPHGRVRTFVIRPWALCRLIICFIYDLIVASLKIVHVIMSGRTPHEAIIRVQTHAHSDGFLAATAGLTALIPGSIVIEAHRRTGVMYVHLFNVDEGDDALKAAHRSVIVQEERILRAFATADELMDAGYRPSGSMKAGRLSEEEWREHCQLRGEIWKAREEES